jgi:hypothetical protein
MGNNIINKLDKLINEALEIKAKHSLKYLIFTLGNTKVNNNYNDEIYLTPIRLGEKSVILGAIVFSETEGEVILKKIDGLFDIIYIDCEKKSKSFSLKDGLFNLERLSTEIIKDSILKYYKGNDLTIESIDKLIYDILKYNDRLVGGTNVLIVGLGNIGFKVSLKLVERGANINILTRNVEKCNKLVETINLVKPIETISSAKVFDKENSQLIKDLDVVVLSHISTVSEYSKIYNKTSKSCVFIDVGKGCLSEGQIKDLTLRGNLCYRLDVGDSMIDLIENDLKYFSKEFKLPSTKIIKNKRIISRGIIGLKDDIVVDDITNPKFIYGICNGKGGFKKNISDDESSFFKILINEKNINNRL